MSVTTPIFRSEVPAADADAPAPADDEAEASVDGDVAGVDAVADCDGLGDVPPPQAATTMARPPNRVRPSERLCMCPPPGSRAVRPIPTMVRDGLEECSPRGATIGAS